MDTFETVYNPTGFESQKSRTQNYENFRDSL